MSNIDKPKKNNTNNNIKFIPFNKQNKIFYENQNLNYPKNQNQPRIRKQIILLHKRFINQIA